MAHVRGVKIWLGTLLPASNAIIDGPTSAPLSEIYREQVNAWIRTSISLTGSSISMPRCEIRMIPTVLNPRYSGADHAPEPPWLPEMAATVKLSILEAALT